VSVPARQLPLTLALTGASGVQYGLRLLEWLLRSGVPVQLLLSKPARVVVSMETDLKLPGRNAEISRYLADAFQAKPGLLQLYGEEQWTAPVASGSAPSGGMVVCPCTTGTLAGIAAGTSRNLMERAADVTLKEGRKLVLVVRETPFSVIHLENMLSLARAGACILPANPGFYHRPREIGDLVDFLVARILDQLGLSQSLLPPWGAETQDDPDA
jgi:4-hydroxy-3-polyprenylbenzoate decarboxylase